MSADQRVTNAREYLGYARQVKVADLPHSAVVRMVAELRRRLVQVLDAVQASVSLDDEQLVTLSQALADALEYRGAGRGLPCEPCQAAEGGLCADHVEDEQRAVAYLTLAAELGIEVER